MAGLLTRESIDQVRQSVHIEDVIGQYVTLKSAGVGSLKGLCPFHDEKTPSFNVRPQVGRFHCFGCGEGGDAITFIERIEHISFVEAVEFLAGKAGITLEYVAGSDRPAQSEVTRSRLIDAHRVAEEFYVNQLKTPAAKAARELLTGRGFDQDSWAHFRVGYSPDSWDALLKELRRNGFTEKEIQASGLVSAGNRGPYDRFRNRLMWPIRSITGDPIGFGARKLGEEEGPKYLNTPETMIYKKSQVLYGLDLAKKAIASDRRIVVVEGYTDVMAAHLAGIPHAVATCGTAFGPEHAKIARRLISDSANPAAGVILSSGKAFGGEVIFTFDGDDAGKKAALRAFHEDQNFAAQTFVVVTENGMDPCDYRLAYGDAALRELISKREPLFAFVIRSVLDGLPLHTAEGRTAGLRAATPILDSIRDRVLRRQYQRELAGWLGVDEREVIQAQRPGAARVAAPQRVTRDPIAHIERQALAVMLQLPGYAHSANAQELPPRTFTVPIHQAIHDAIRAAGGVAIFTERLSQGDQDAGAWYLDQVLAQADPVVAQAITELAVSELPEKGEDQWPYVRGIMMSLIRQGITRQIADVRSQLQRSSEADQEALFARLLELEQQRRAFDETDT